VSLELPELDGYEVARVPSFRAEKAYVCPECRNAIPPGTGHVVAWRHDLVEDRRHWHLHCWRHAVRRGWA
jgi:hypothetical protein